MRRDRKLVVVSLQITGWILFQSVLLTIAVRAPSSLSLYHDPKTY